jgi:predicted phage terminase large subunit-like protein
MVAPESVTYQTCGGSWRRRVGDLLRPDAYSEKDIKQRRETSVNPDFETLFQQNPDGELAVHIEPHHFASFEAGNSCARLPIVLSVDPGHVAGSNHSFSVIQAWTRSNDVFWLLDQWREQAEAERLEKVLCRYRAKYRPSRILIEQTGLGIGALSYARRRGWKGVYPIVPDRRSKPARLLEHAPAILAQRISLPANAPWREAFIAEFVAFPHGDFDDQVDATTQYLDWISKHPVTLEPPPARPAMLMVRGRVVQPSRRGYVFARSR